MKVRGVVGEAAALAAAADVAAAAAALRDSWLQIAASNSWHTAT